MGDLHLGDVILCGGCVVVVILLLGVFCCYVDQEVDHGHGITHTGRSRRRACQRDREHVG